MAHSLHALALVSLGDIRSDKRKRHGVQLPSEHRVHIEDQFPGDAVLVGRHAQIQRAHRPFDGRPMQGGKAGADADRATRQIPPGRGENGRAGIMFQYEVLEPEQILPGGRKGVPVPIEGNALCQSAREARAGRGLQNPCAIARRIILEERPTPGRRGKEALRPDLKLPPGLELLGERGPIEAAIRANARILCDAKAILEEKQVNRTVHRSILHGCILRR